MSPDLLHILVCPETHQPLRSAAADLLADLNRRIGEGTVRNRAGQVVRDPLEEGLLRQDGALVYPVRHGLPIMLLDEAIPLGAA